jgi:site-specific DNA-methyltransferase (adenine-specific)
LHGDNLPLLRELDDGVVQMVYADPPFNTGRTQARDARHRRPPRTATAPASAAAGTRPRCCASPPTGRVRRLPRLPRAALRELRRVLHPTGTLYLHLDYREAHYVKLLLDELFGRECFLNELIWAYDYGASQAPLAAEARHDPRLRQGSRRRTSSTPRRSTREPYMAPGLVTPEQRRAGKLPVSVIWHTIVSPTGPREDRLPDPEARGAGPALRAGLSDARATCAWTRSPARARSGAVARSSAAATC